MNQYLDIKTFSPDKDGLAERAVAYIYARSVSKVGGGSKGGACSNVIAETCFCYEDVENQIKEIEKDLQSIRRRAKKAYDDHAE